MVRQLPDVQVVIGDLGDPRIVEHAVDGARIVYHVGAAMRGGPRDFEAGTVWGTRNVVAACLKHHTQRLVYVSSLSVLDHAGRDPAVMMTESSNFEPYPERRGAYTQTKLTAEAMVSDAIRDHALAAVILRPGQIVGPGAERVTPNGTLAIAGRWIAVGSASQTLPLVYVDDVVDALLLAANASPRQPARSSTSSIRQRSLKASIWTASRQAGQASCDLCDCPPAYSCCLPSAWKCWAKCWAAMCR
jgi:nucleoside-diphosphate-sugar epimerase